MTGENRAKVEREMNERETEPVKSEDALIGKKRTTPDAHTSYILSSHSS
jgi:hypothetical protein